MQLIDQKAYDRRLFIGGSDAAAVLGLSPWRSPLDVWLEKTGKAAGKTETEAMRWGTALEQVVADRFAQDTGLAVWRTTKVCVGTVGDDRPGVLAASLDRLVTPSRSVKPITRKGLVAERILEVKTSRSDDGWGEEGTDEIPLHYLPQVHQYLGITGAKECHVAVLISGSDYRAYRVEADREVWGNMRERLEQWWIDHVVGNTAPEPRTADEVERLFPQSVQRNVVADEAVEKAVINLRNLKALIEKYKVAADAEEDAICTAIGNADGLITPDGTPLVTWKTSKGSTKTDWEAIAREVGASEELVKKHTQTGQGSRRFLLKLKGSEA